MGVNGISIRRRQVIGMITTTRRDALVVTENGFGKRTLSEYRVQNRHGVGLIVQDDEAHRKPDRYRQVTDEDDVLLINDHGIIIRFRASEIPVMGRITSGVTLMKVREGLVVDMSVVSPDEEREHETVNGRVPEDMDDDEYLIEEVDEESSASEVTSEDDS